MARKKAASHRSLLEKAKRIRLLLLDVDGVLTDGRIWTDAEGHEYKSFHVPDAAGLCYWHKGGGLSGQAGALRHGISRYFPFMSVMALP